MRILDIARSNRTVAALLGGALLLTPACASDGRDDPNDGSPRAGRQSGIQLGGGLGVGGRPPTGPGSGGSTASPCEDTSLDGCVGLSYEGESIPLDIYIMFDQSGSMLNDVGGMTRLEAVQKATAEFLRAPESASIGVGIGYFGFLPIGQASCDASTYAAPDVGVTLDHEQVIRSLGRREPTGETPTAAALYGACSYATEWKRDNPGHAVVILLVTDGVPEAPVTCASGTCCPTLAEATEAASACATQNPNIPTYVLGVGPALGNLGNIATAGKTKGAYLVEDRNATTEVLKALNAIRGDALVPCDLEIPPAPPGSTLDYGRVNLLYATSGCSFEPMYYVESERKCEGGPGWYYDDPSRPSRVKLCPSSCDIVSQPNVSVRFSVGCQTIPPPVR